MSDYLSFLKNFQTILTSFQDIGTIYDKLEVQGHLKKLVSLFIEIFNEEHEFTLGELKRYGQEQNVKEEDFLEEQYELNSTIFRKNFSLIVQSLAEEIGKGFLNKFRAENNIEGGRKYSGTIKIEPDILDDQRPSGVQKPQYKSDMPEIQEEIESTGRISPPKSSARSMQSEPESFPKSARNFDLNIDELQHKSHREGQSAQPTASSDRLGRIDQSLRVTSPNSTNRQKEMMPTEAVAKALGTDHMAYAASELRRMKEGLKSSSSSREISQEQLSPHNPLPRSPSYERQTHSSMNQSRISSYSHQGFSTSNKFFKSPGSSVSSSRYSAMGNPTVDPTVLDSEFSHTRGISFGRSERLGLFSQGNAPGPGAYEPEEGLNVVKKKAPTASFSRSPKFSIFDKAMSESPGAIYYPSHHFVSK